MSQDKAPRRRRLTEAARMRIRQNNLRNKPWLRSTGPKTAEGKAQAALNGKTRQKGEYSVREKKRMVGVIKLLINRMSACRMRLMADLNEEVNGDGES